MKLAIVIPGFQAGAHDWCIPAFTNLAHTLAREHEVHVFALRYPHVRLRSLRRYSVGNVRVHALGGGIIRGRRYKVLSLLKLWRDAVHAISMEHRRSKLTAIIGIWATESGWLATRAGMRIRVPSVVHIAGGELTWIPEIRYGTHPARLARLLVSRSLRNADLVTIPSGPLMRAIPTNIIAGKVEAWPLGVDTSLFCPPDNSNSVQQRPFTFITTGSLIPVKGHNLLLTALSHLRRTAPDLAAELRVVGTGPLLPQLTRQVERLELVGYVDFVGEVAHHDLPALYREADCFILGSWHEGQCMAALEAMACGLPWVGPPVGALADIAAQSGSPSGTLVTERTPAAMARAMLSIMSLPEEVRRVWGAAARRHVEQDYQLQRQTARLVQLIENL